MRLHYCCNSCLSNKLEYFIRRNIIRYSLKSVKKTIAWYSSLKVQYDHSHLLPVYCLFLKAWEWILNTMSISGSGTLTCSGFGLFSRESMFYWKISWFQQKETEMWNEIRRNCSNTECKYKIYWYSDISECVKHLQSKYWVPRILVPNTRLMLI